MMYKPLVYEHLKPFRSTEGYWSTTACVDVAKDILDITQAKIMLEIGFNIGYSASTWLSHGIEHLIAIDIGYHPDTLSAIKATALAYKPKRVQWWIGDSKSPEAKELDIEEVHMAFIDGEHTYRAAMSDSQLSIEYGAEWLVYDDVIDGHSNGIASAIESLQAAGKIEVAKRYPMTWTEQGEVVLCKVHR